MRLNSRRFPGRIDAATGAYTITGLPDGTFDVVIETDDVRVEGIGLAVPRKLGQPKYDYIIGSGALDYVCVKTEELFDPDEDIPDEEKDRRVRKALRLDSLLRKVDSTLKVDRFMDVNRALIIRGTPEQAFVLVELKRERAFHSEEGDEGVWRVEIWPYRWYYGGWVKDQARVIHRLRAPAAEIAALGVVFELSLGGVVIQNGGNVKGIDYNIPAEWDPALGKLPRR